ncbi:MAG: hypothetical protein AB1742_04995 [bacterium]
MSVVISARKLTKAPLGLRYADTQCGFKLLASTAAKKIALISRVNRFAFDAELLTLARKANLKVAELPVRCRNSPRSKVRLFADSAIMLKDLVRIKLDDLKNRLHD